MQPKWDDNLPIYRQLKDRVLEMILDGALGDGDALPSVRTVAAEYQVNPLTVLKSYQALVDEGLVEKQRGKGMYVVGGARGRLLARERRRFQEEEWPRVLATLSRLGLKLEDLSPSRKQNEESKR
jgi:GntR family transcriptional regulator